MKFTDIIALAKAGYSPADVREFMNKDISDTSTTALEAVSPAPDVETTAPEAVSPAPDVETTAPEAVSLAPDVVSELTEDQKKIIDLEAKIAEMQKANVNKNLSDVDNTSDEDRLKELVRSFM